VDVVQSLNDSGYLDIHISTQYTISILAVDRYRVGRSYWYDDLCRLTWRTLGALSPVTTTLLSLTSGQSLQSLLLTNTIILKLIVVAIFILGLNIPISLYKLAFYVILY